MRNDNSEHRVRMMVNSSLFERLMNHTLSIDVPDDNHNLVFVWQDTLIFSIQKSDELWHRFYDIKPENGGYLIVLQNGNKEFLPFDDLILLTIKVQSVYEWIERGKHLSYLADRFL